MPALSATARREYYCEIGNAMPPPVLHNQELHDRRHTAAVEVFEALRPADADEARLAVRIVLAGAHAAECLREAGVYREDYAKRTRCRAQAAAMMRAEGAAKRALAQQQKMRLATEAVADAALPQPAAVSAAPSHAEPLVPPLPLIQTAAGAPQFVQAAIAPSPVKAAAAAPSAAPVPLAVAPPPPASGTTSPAAVSSTAPPHAAAFGTAPPRAASGTPRPPAATGSGTPRPPAATGSASLPSPEAIAMAEAYVQQNLVAAAQIRHDRGVTPQSTAYFRHLTLPADPAVIDALVRGTSFTLTMLDDIGGETLVAAA